MSPPVSQDVRWAQIPEWVLFHPELSGTDVRVFAALQRYAGSSATCWPGVPKLAEALSVADKTVRRSIDTLASVGALMVEPRMVEGRQSTNRYHLWMAGPHGTPVSKRVVTSDQGEVVTSVQAEREPEEREPTTRVRDTDVPFDAFWGIYPRRDDKRAARKAWDALAKKGELPALDVILEGALRYAGEVEGRERRFVKLPATWLNAGSWGNGHDAKAEGEWTEWG